MSESANYDPQASYDVIYEGDKIAEVIKGKYYEHGTRDTHDGEIVGDVFRYHGSPNFGAPAGKLVGLTIVRDDDGTTFHLVLQE